jgi:hypothetical protein
MGNIHSATGADGVKFKYQEPSTNSKGETKGILYEKKDSKTGEIKLKSADGLVGHLLMKLRGYSTANYQTCGAFLEAKFPGPGAFHATVYDIRQYVTHTKFAIPADPFNKLMTDIQTNRDFADDFLKDKAQSGNK